MLSDIPSNAKVSASQSIAPHLSQRAAIYQFPDAEDAEYLAFFTFHDFYNISDKKYFDTVNYYIHNPQWDVISQSYPFMLLKKQANHLKPSAFIIYDARKITLDSLCDALSDTNLNLLANGYPLLLFAKEPQQKGTGINFYCTTEKVSEDGKKFIASNNELIDMGGQLSDERLRTGKHSLKLSGEDHYGMNYQLNNIKMGDIIIVSAWRNSQGNTGKIVVSDNNNFFYYANKVIAHDTNGWEKISLILPVTSNYKKLRLYLWNNGTLPIYFDDMKVTVSSQLRIMN
jgi:hypothetical protein